MWLWNLGSSSSKAQFYVWYLGSKEASGVRGPTVVLPVMRQLLRESFRKSINKATVQVSNKGLKLIQSVLTMSKGGKMKTQLVKISVASNCITYKSAALLQANLQMLIGRPENQKSINALEERLFLTNIWEGKIENSNNNLNTCSTLRPARRLQSELKTRLRSTQSEQDADLASLGPAFLGRENGAGGGGGNYGGLNVPPYLRNKRYSVSDLPSLPTTANAAINPRLRMFGDTLVDKKDKSRSIDGLNKVSSNVSRNLRGEASFRIERFPRSEACDPFGRIYEQSMNFDGFWKNRSKQRNLKI
uniref:Uncharacterized protein n=1 Tax=Panagrolaimus sp. PS1159 TaxID=55785 RepID=A0AC35G7G7_9BILA